MSTGGPGIRWTFGNVICMGRPPVISRDKVAAATLDILDAEGIEAVSIERIAREVGVKGPTLYHHFSDKAEILSEVARMVLGNLEVDPAITDWQEWMIEMARTFYRRLQAHPNAIAVLIESLPETEALLGLEHAARLLTEAGIDQRVQLLLMEGTEKITWGWALHRAATVHHGSRLTKRAVGKRWPTLAKAAGANSLDDEAMLEASIRGFHAGVLAGDAVSLD